VGGGLHVLDLHPEHAKLDRDSCAHRALGRSGLAVVGLGRLESALLHVPVHLHAQPRQPRRAISPQVDISDAGQVVLHHAGRLQFLISRSIVHGVVGIPIRLLTYLLFREHHLRSGLPDLLDSGVSVAKFDVQH